jgi:hypothetical protein
MVKAAKLTVMAFRWPSMAWRSYWIL